MKDLIVTDIFEKYIVRIPVDITDQDKINYCGDIVLIPHANIKNFLNDLSQRIENAVWEKIKNAKNN